MDRATATLIVGLFIGAVGGAVGVAAAAPGDIVRLDNFPTRPATANETTAFNATAVAIFGSTDVVQSMTFTRDEANGAWRVDGVYYRVVNVDDEANGYRPAGKVQANGTIKVFGRGR